MSAALCFGGGVLFATSVIHILPDVERDLPSWSQLVFCLGFLLIYFLDVVVQFLTRPSPSNSKFKYFVKVNIMEKMSENISA